jgi:NADH-quinone oxidoreductase subunit H
MPSLSQIIGHPLFPRFVTMAVVMVVILTAVAYLVMLERKVSAWMQDRLGPNRVGPRWAPAFVRRWGLVQALVDGIKMFLKEDIVPRHVDKVFYVLAPAVAAATSLLAFAVVPFGYTTAPPLPVAVAGAQPNPEELELFLKGQADYRAQYQSVIVPGLDVGILFTFAVGSLAVYGLVLGGWSANNKYSLLGALRSSAQIISYEIPMGLSVLGVVLLCGSLNLERIVAVQVEHGPLILYQPLAFLLFLTAVFAECNRLPFDLPEAEQELVAGYYTEYSSLKFGLFMLGEYAHMITVSALLSVLFLGGWHFPFGSYAPEWLRYCLGLVWMVGKVLTFIVLFMLVRWSLPRFRFDQLMGVAWQVLIPLAVLNVVAVMLVQEFLRGWPFWARGLVLAAASVALFLGSAWFSARPLSVSSPGRRAPRPEPVGAGARDGGV